VRGTVIGALRVADVAGRPFTDDEVHLAQAFADHAAFSLENARLYAELDAQLHQLETTQQQLVQAGKLAAVGQLVTGIAHEINNPLATIMGQAEMLSRRLSDAGQLERVAKIADCAMRAATIVRGLQTFVRPQPHEVAALDLRDVVARVTSLRRDAMRFNGVELIEDLPEGVPLVLGDAGQLEQVVLNLVINAEQAVAAVTSAPRIAIGLSVHDSRVRLSVADTGPGIPADILPRIFEPFFSTKAPTRIRGWACPSPTASSRTTGGGSSPRASRATGRPSRSSFPRIGARSPRRRAPTRRARRCVAGPSWWSRTSLTSRVCCGTS